MSDAPGPGPLDWCRDAFARVTADGRLLAANPPMHALLAGLGVATPTLDSLPLAEPLRLRLVAGAEVVCEPAPDRAFALRLRTDGQGQRWLQADDLGDLRTLADRLQALQRVRLLGRLAQGIVHDLNNVLGTTIGLAEQMETLVAPADRAFVAGLIDSVRHGSQMIRTLSGMLRVSPRQHRVADLAEVAREAMTLFGKSAVKRGCAVEFTVRATADVRVVVEEAMQILLLCCVLAMDTSDGGPQLVVVDSSPATGTAGRPVGRIRIVDHGPLSGYAAVVTAIERPDAGLRAAFAALPGDGTGLLQAVLTHCASGGDLSVGITGDGRRELTLAWPVVRA